MPLPVVFERTPSEDLPYADASLMHAGPYIGVQWGEQLAVVEASGRELRRVTTGPITAWAFSSTGAIAWSSGRDLVVVQPDGTTRREALRVWGPPWLPRPAWAESAFLYSSEEDFLEDLTFTPDGTGLVIGTGYDMLRLDARTLAQVWRIQPEYGPLHIGFVGDTLWMSDAFANHLYDASGRETGAFGGGFATDMVRDDAGRLWTLSSPDAPALWNEADWTKTYPFGTADLTYSFDYARGFWLLDADLTIEGARFSLGHSTMEASALFVGESIWVADTSVVRRYRVGSGLVQQAFVPEEPGDLYGAFFALERTSAGLWSFDGDEGVLHGPFGEVRLGLEDPTPLVVSLRDGAWILDVGEGLFHVTEAGRVERRPFPGVYAAARLANGRWVAAGTDVQAIGPVRGRRVSPRVPVSGYVRAFDLLDDGRLAWADDKGLHLTDPVRWSDTVLPFDLEVESVTGHKGRLLVSGEVAADPEDIQVTDLLDPSGARLARIVRDFHHKPTFLPDGSFLVPDQDLRHFGPDGTELRAWRVASGYGFADVFVLADGTIAVSQRWEDGDRWWSVEVGR